VSRYDRSRRLRLGRGVSTPTGSAPLAVNCRCRRAEQRRGGTRLSRNSGPRWTRAKARGAGRRNLRRGPIAAGGSRGATARGRTRKAGSGNTPTTAGAHRWRRSAIVTSKVGDYVAPGTRLMTGRAGRRGSTSVANFKENADRSHEPRDNPRASKWIALPGVALRGKVESFAPGSGLAVFRCCRSKPGTGNFTQDRSSSAGAYPFRAGADGNWARLRQGPINEGERAPD